MKHTEALDHSSRVGTISASQWEQAQAAPLMVTAPPAPTTINTRPCSQWHPAAQRLQDMGRQRCQEGVVLWIGLSQTFPSNRPQASSASLLSQQQSRTLISGTTILDSGFLSSIRVIRSFKSSAISGLGVETHHG